MLIFLIDIYIYINKKYMLFSSLTLMIVMITIIAIDDRSDRPILFIIAHNLVRLIVTSTLCVSQFNYNYN